MESSEELKQEVFKLYNQSPRGWHVLVAQDMKGRVDTFIIKGDDVWFLKEELINPYERLGVGEKMVVRGASGKMKETSFGFRSLAAEALRRIGGSADDPKGIDTVIRQVLKTDPLPLSSIRTPLILEGPVAVSGSVQAELFEGQRELAQKLGGELNRLLELRYPHLRRMYG